MARFTLPRDLYHGKGALEALKDFEGKRAMICVGGGSMKRFGFLDRAKQYLEEAGMEVCLFEGIEPDPSVETVMKGAKAMEEFKPDWIVAMGGGSPIDAAKAMWIKYEYPDITFEDMCKVFGIPKLRKKAHFCAISSTSGTATEVTAFSIITDYEKGIKYPIADFEITPDVAIVDPELAETMPQKLVAHTGMDAMTHAIEAYVSTANCDFTDPLALHAIKMIQNDLLQPINFDHIPNASNIGDMYYETSEQFDPGNLYSIPYCWGTVGILYNKKMVTEPIDSWSVLWDTNYRDSILMQDSVRDAFAVALKDLGYSLNSTNIKELTEAKDLLVTQKPLVQAYVVDQVRDKMIGNEAAIGVIYSGEAIYTKRENPDLEYVVPKEGSNVWIDSWCIPKDAQHVENAEKFLNFLCRPDIALKNFKYITYSTPNDAARELIEDDDIRNSEIAFPDEETLARCETFTYLGDDADEVYNQLWREVKSN